MIEFAAILVPLLILFYGIITYSLVFVTQQAVSFAADRGAAEAVTVNPQLPDVQLAATVKPLAQKRINQLLRFLPGSAAVTSVDTVRAPAGQVHSRRVEVKVQYPFSNWGFPVPAFLPMPNLIRSQGVASVSATGP